MRGPVNSSPACVVAAMQGPPAPITTPCSVPVCISCRSPGATIVPSLGSATAHGTPAADAERQAINAFIRAPGSFDGVFDFDAATRDPLTGGLRAAFQPNSTTGGPGDRLHPNRAGYLAMGQAVDLDALSVLFTGR